MVWQMSDATWNRLRKCHPALQATVVEAASYKLIAFEAVGEPDGPNCLSHYINLVPDPIGPDAGARFAFLAGVVCTAGRQRGYDIEWGGFMDSLTASQKDRFGGLSLFQFTEIEVE